jgi:hypothetical protein
MELRQSLFWDVDPKTIDFKKNANYVIERILDFGKDEEVKWMWEFYDKDQLREVVNNSRSIRKDTKNLWSLLLEKK